VFAQLQGSTQTDRVKYTLRLALHRQTAIIPEVVMPAFGKFHFQSLGQELAQLEV
jgi:hypothetical protein